MPEGRVSHRLATVVYVLAWCSALVYCAVGAISTEMRVLIAAVLMLIAPDWKDLFRQPR